jgi:hypothetical protein
MPITGRSRARAEGSEPSTFSEPSNLLRRRRRQCPWREEGPDGRRRRQPSCIPNSHLFNQRKRCLPAERNQTDEQESGEEFNVNHCAHASLRSFRDDPGADDNPGHTDMEYVGHDERDEGNTDAQWSTKHGLGKPEHGQDEQADDGR